MKHMLAVPLKRADLDKFLMDENYVAEQKFSGIRAFIYKSPSYFKIITRGGHDITHLLPHLQYLNNYKYNNIVLDCELYSPSLTDAQVAGFLNYRKDTPTKYNHLIIPAFFDVIYDNDTDMPYIERRKLLQSYSLANTITVALKEKDKRELFDRMKKDKKEGIMFKHVNSPYLCGQRKVGHWYKYKFSKTYSCIIGGFNEGKGKFKDMVGSIKLYQYNKNGVLEYVGNCSGMTDAVRWEMTYKPELYLNKVAEIEANGYTDNKFLRHSRFLYLRHDLSDKDCIVE